ncbi:MAG: hypothetical protein ABI471_04240 [Sphingomonas bacterium]
MRGSRAISTVVGVALVATSSGSNAIVARPAETVGPPQIWFASSGPCRTMISEPGGKTSGAEIPIAALRLGSPVSRGKTSFTTGGGGTSNASEMMRRKQAGLPYVPATFDSSSSALPVVYAAQPSETNGAYPYQRLPLKPVSGAYDPWALIFAQPISGARGQIVSLSLDMKNMPAATPKLRVVSGLPVSSGACQRQTLDVYAPAMTAGQVRGLFSTSSCNWYRLSTCQRSQWPRGRVLFVLRYEKATRDTYRWVDYDLLARARFAKSS